MHPSFFPQPSPSSVPGSSSSPDPTAAFHNYYHDPRAYPPPSYPYQPSAPPPPGEQPPCGCCFFSYRDNRGKMSLEAPFNGPSPPPLLSSAYSSYTTPPPAAPYATLASCLPSLSSRWPGEPPQQIIWSRGSSPFSPATHALYSNQVTACYAHSSSTNGPPTNRSELHARRTGEQAQHSAAELKIEVREERSEKDDDDDLQNGHSTSGSPPSKKPRRSVERDRSQTSNNKSRVSQRPKKKRQPEEGDENRERTSFDIERQRLTELRRKKGMRVKKSFLRQGPNELDFHLDRPKNAPKKSSKKRTKAGAQEGPSFRPNGSSSPERLFQPQLLQPQPPGEWQGSAATTTTLSAPFARGHTSSPLRSSVSGAATTATATRQPHWRT